jgi:hypothetical protein
MQWAVFTEEEIQLAAERRRKYIGTAKVSISQLQFDPPLPQDLDPKNLGRLREIFRKNCCRRLDVDNHVPAIVSQEDLAAALLTNCGSRLGSYGPFMDVTVYRWEPRCFLQLTVSGR